MIGLHRNRVPGTGSSAIRRSRTVAQREASRRNGSKSRGPTTAEGKARSSANSRKHGLLAQHLVPAPDSRELDALYRRIRGELVDEFEPEGFTEWALIDSLASDYVQLTRAKGLIEAAHAARRNDEKFVRERRQLKRDLRLAERFLSGRRWQGGAKSAMSLSRRLARLVEQVKNEATGDEFENDPGRLEGEEREELLESLRRWEALRPSYRKLTDPSHVAAVLCGEVQPSGAEVARLRTSLTEIVAGLRRRIAAAAAEQAKLRLHQANADAILSAAPENLLLLQRYTTTIERHIERKVRQLKREFSGSFRKK